MSAMNLPASVRARLRNLAERDRVDFGSILTRYALERMLYRLSVGESRDQFLLKGALLFDVWFDTPARPTRDIDLLAFGPADGDRITEVFRAACSLDVPDGITFDPDTVLTADIRNEAGYPGIRATMRGELDGAQIFVQVDIGFGDAVTPGPTAVMFPVLLDDMPSPVLSAYPKPTVIAEKLEAIVRFGRVNSRLKDYFDLWILLVTVDADRPDVTLAIAATFARRNTPIPATTPSGLTDEFAEDPRVVAQWRTHHAQSTFNTRHHGDHLSTARGSHAPVRHGPRCSALTCASARHAISLRSATPRKCAREVQACTPRGVQRGVQKWPFVKATRRARNPKIVHPQFLPTTSEEDPSSARGPLHFLVMYQDLQNLA